MKKVILILFLCCLVNAVNSQIYVNPGVDTSSQQIKRAISFMESYIKDFKQDKKVDFSQYYKEKDYKRYEKPDKVAYSLIGNNPVYIMGTPTLLSAKEKCDTVRLKLQFSDVDTSGNIKTYFISNHIIVLDQTNHYFLVNHEINTSSWMKTKIRNITFQYPNYYSLDTSRANKLIRQVKNLEDNWNLSPEIIDYYFARRRKEIQKIRGFDFNIYMGGNEVPTGLADVKDNLIFTSGLNENHFHEVVHIYLNKEYPESPIKEGIAVFLGGSLGHDLKWHLEKLDTFIANNPEIEINNPQSFHYLDDTTNPQYAIQGLLCHLAYKRGGINELKELMEFNSLEQIYSDYFNIDKGKENEFLRKEIIKYCR